MVQGSDVTSFDRHLKSPPECSLCVSEPGVSEKVCAGADAGLGRRDWSSEGGWISVRLTTGLATDDVDENDEALTMTDTGIAVNVGLGVLGGLLASNNLANSESWRGLLGGGSNWDSSHSLSDVRTGERLDTLGGGVSVMLCCWQGASMSAWRCLGDCLLMASRVSTASRSVVCTGETAPCGPVKLILDKSFGE